MINTKKQKSVSQNMPLSSFAPFSGDGRNTDMAAYFRQQLYQRFGTFPGELKISVAQEIVTVQWYFPEINEKAEFFHGKALEYAKKKDFRTAIASWQDAVALNPQDPDYLFNLGAAHLEMKQYSEALSPFQKAAELCPIYPKVHLFLGTLFLKLRKVKPAAKFLENNLFFQPNDALALLNLGISYSILRDHQQAIDMYRRTLAIRPQELRAHMGLAKIYALLDKPQEANTCFRKVIELDPNGKLGNYAKRAIVQQPEKTATDKNPKLNVTKPIGDIPKQAENFYSEGYLQFISANFSKAEFFYRKYLEIKPGDAYVWAAVGEMCLRQRKLTEAVAAFSKAISHDRKGVYFKELAIALDLKKQPRDSLQAAKLALQLGKQDSIVYLLAGQSLRKLKQPEEAVKMLQQSIRLNKNNFMARYQMALTALQLGDSSLAVAQLEEIMAVKADLSLKEKANSQLKKIMKN